MGHIPKNKQLTNLHDECALRNAYCSWQSDAACYVQVAEEYLSPIQIKHGTFIFITGRWQLLTQDAELIRKPVLHTAAGGINDNKK